MSETFDAADDAAMRWTALPKEREALAQVIRDAYLSKALRDAKAKYTAPQKPMLCKDTVDYLL